MSLHDKAINLLVDQIEELDANTIAEWVDDSITETDYAYKVVFGQRVALTLPELYEEDIYQTLAFIEDEAEHMADLMYDGAFDGGEPWEVLSDPMGNHYLGDLIATPMPEDVTFDDVEAAAELLQRLLDVPDHTRDDALWVASALAETWVDDTLGGEVSPETLRLLVLSEEVPVEDAVYEVIVRYGKDSLPAKEDVFTHIREKVEEMLVDYAKQGGER